MTIQNNDITNQFPHADRARQGLNGIDLHAEASYRYRGMRIDVEHLEVGENCPDLIFSVNFGIMPRTFKRLTEACEYIDGALEHTVRLT